MAPNANFAMQILGELAASMGLLLTLGYTRNDVRLRRLRRLGAERAIVTGERPP